MNIKALDVLRLFTAGKKPEALTEALVKSSVEAPAEILAKVSAEAPAKEPEMIGAFTKRFYFYEARPEDAIDFENIDKLLSTDSMEKDALIKKLQGGSGGRDTFTAAYFSWKKLVVATNIKSPKGKSIIVYYCNLAPDGSREGKGIIVPEGSATTAENIEQEMSLFSRKFNKDILNIDTGNAVFINGDITNEIIKAMLAWHFPVGDTYEKFKDVFKRYRIWIESEGRLYLPNHKLPSQEGLKDGVKGGYYPGGKEAYNKMIAPKITTPKIKEKPKGPTLEEKMKGMTPKEEKKVSPYEPVPKSVAPEKGDVLDMPTEVKMAAEEGDYASEPYSGGTNVVQELVRDQHKKMKIRRMARDLVINYLKDAQISTVQPGTTPSTLSVTTGKRPSIPISDVSTENMMSAKTLQDIAKQQQKMEREINKMRQNIVQRTQQMSSGK